MAVDQITPRSRRAVLAGALGGVAASLLASVRAPVVRAGVDGDVVLDAVNTGAGTTEIDAATSNPAFRVVGGGSAIQAAGNIAVDAAGSIAVNGISTDAGGLGIVGWSQASTTGMLGWSTTGTQSTPAVPANTGVHGVAEQDATARGVFGRTTAGQGVRGEATTGIGVAAVAADGLAISALSTLGHGVRGRGQLDGVIGESATGRSGIVGYSGSGSAPAGPAKTGVYGEATQDAASRGVSGFTLAGQGVHGDATSGQGVAGVATTGQGVKGTATTGIGVQASATTGVALDVAGRVTFSRSGRINVPINRNYVDVTVPGGLLSTANVIALLQYPRSGCWVEAARLNYPTVGKVRIYLSKVASTATTTPLAWFVIG